MAPWNPYWIPMFGMLMGLASILVTAWVIYVIVDGFRRRQQVRATAEFQARLLDRIGSAREFGEFVSSPEGTRFLESITPKETRPESRILASLPTGFVALFVGIALFMFSAGGIDRELEALLMLLGAVAVAAGLGLLVSAGASYWLSRRLGLTRSGGETELTPRG